MKEKQFVLDGFVLDLDETHQLPNFMAAYPTYDRFVPFLGKICDLKSRQDKITNPFFIDIGANIGDTAAGIIRHTKASILCIEPDEHYFIN